MARDYFVLAETPPALMSLFRMDEKSRLKEQAERSRRIAEKINEPSTHFHVFHHIPLQEGAN